MTRRKKKDRKKERKKDRQTDRECFIARANESKHGIVSESMRANNRDKISGNNAGIVFACSYLWGEIIDYFFVFEEDNVISEKRGRSALFG